MRRLTILIICFIIFLFKPLYAQETKKINNAETGETYDVLKSNKGIKHGEYQKKGLNKLYVKGTYTNGNRSGIWEFSNINGKLLSRYDFDNNKLLLFNVKNENRPNNKLSTLDTLTRPAIYVGGYDYILSEMAKTLRYPATARSNNVTGRVYVTFTVTKEGKATNFHVKRRLGYGLDEEAIRVLQPDLNLWLPALENGVAVDSELNYPIVFRLQSQVSVN